jgi:hypothetical protein
MRIRLRRQSIVTVEGGIKTSGPAWLNQASLQRQLIAFS